ncbi:MAG: hypothetical protein JWN56_2627 [Sphingobacteriales bacterium]|nr:hypothetical protein [Sphingobacteriales bacterium]
MKQAITAFLAVSILLTGCATVQSIVRSSFPYTATLIIPSSSNVNSTLSARSSATSFDQIFTGKTTNNENIKEVRITSAKIIASSPANQNLGVFRSVKVFISMGDGSSEVLVANRTDISSNPGNSLVLDIDNSKFLDSYLKSSSVRIRMEYVLKDQLNVDLSVKASLGFSASPGTTN